MWFTVLIYFNLCDVFSPRKFNLHLFRVSSVLPDNYLIALSHMYAQMKVYVKIGWRKYFSGNLKIPNTYYYLSGFTSVSEYVQALLQEIHNWQHEVSGELLLHLNLCDFKSAVILVGQTFETTTVNVMCVKSDN